MNQFRPFFVIAAVVIALAVMRANNAQAQIVHQGTSYPKIMSLKCVWDYSGDTFRADIFKSPNANIMPPYLLNISTESKNNPLWAFGHHHFLAIETYSKWTLMINREDLDFVMVDHRKGTGYYVPDGDCHKTSLQF